jgi:hypothetical protein
MSQVDLAEATQSTVRRIYFRLDGRFRRMEPIGKFVAIFALSLLFITILHLSWRVGIKLLIHLELRGALNDYRNAVSVLPSQQRAEVSLDTIAKFVSDDVTAKGNTALADAALKFSESDGVQMVFIGEGNSKTIQYYVQRMRAAAAFRVGIEMHGFEQELFVQSNTLRGTPLHISSQFDANGYLSSHLFEAIVTDPAASSEEIRAISNVVQDPSCQTDLPREVFGKACAMAVHCDGQDASTLRGNPFAILSNFGINGEDLVIRLLGIEDLRKLARVKYIREDAKAIVANPTNALAAGTLPSMKSSDAYLRKVETTLSKCVKDRVECDARLDCIKVLIACREYYLKERKQPSDLESLVPAYLSEVPKNAVTGKSVEINQMLEAISSPEITDLFSITFPLLAIPDPKFFLPFREPRDFPDKVPLAPWLKERVPEAVTPPERDVLVGPPMVT